jgi:hypothetical protein
MRRQSMAGWVALLAIPMSQGVAQSTAQDSVLVLQPGVRVRILAPQVTKDRIAGTIHAVRDDVVVIDTVDSRLEHRLFFPSTIVVEQYRRVALPVSAVASVEESRGHSRVLGMVKGAAKGALVVGLFAGLGSLSGKQNASLRDFTSGFGVGAATGAVIGAPIGFKLGVERWREVRAKLRRTAPSMLAESEK